MESTTKARFFDAVRDHRLTVFRDDDVNRHIRLSRPSSSVYRFDLITWPGYLTVCGDIGTYVFARTLDMFSFFRSTEGEHRINPDYWSKKLEASDTCRGNRGLQPYMTFSNDLFTDAVRADLRDHLERNDHLSLSERKRIVWAARADLFDSGYSDTREAINAAVSWCCPVTAHAPFSEIYEHSLEDYDFGFLFACHAIVWGIKRYDLHTSGRTQEDHDRRVLAGVL